MKQARKAQSEKAQAPDDDAPMEQALSQNAPKSPAKNVQAPEEQAEKVQAEKELAEKADAEMNDAAEGGDRDDVAMSETPRAVDLEQPKVNIATVVDRDMLIGGEGASDGSVDELTRLIGHAELSTPVTPAEEEDYYDPHMCSPPTMHAMGQTLSQVQHPFERIASQGPAGTGTGADDTVSDGEGVVADQVMAETKADERTKGRGSVARLSGVEED